MEVNEMMVQTTIMALKRARNLGLEDMGLLEDWEELKRGEDDGN